MNRMMEYEMQKKASKKQFIKAQSALMLQNLDELQQEALV